MKQEDRAKNWVKKVYTEILIPMLNEYLLKDMKHWAKKAYHKARIQVSRRKAKKIKEMMPFETAAYAEDKVFGNWRLVAPDGPDKISPLKQVITLIRPDIDPTRWGEFRREFVREIKIDFNAICDADYDPAMVDEVNGRLNRLITGYCHAVPNASGSASTETPKQVPARGEARLRRRGDISCHFVLKPETAQGYSSPEFMKIRSGIWERFTGQPLDLSMFQNPAAAGLQMEMYLDIQIFS